MEVLQTNEQEWRDFVNHNSLVVNDILKYVEINETCYKDSPFSKKEGYGIRIFLFSELKEFLSFMIEKELFERGVEFIELVDEDGGWFCLSYLLSSDVGLVAYIKV